MIRFQSAVVHLERRHALGDAGRGRRRCRRCRSSARHASRSALERPAVADVGRHRAASAGRAPRSRRPPRRRRRAAPAGDDDVGAGVGEPERERAADAARAADDDGRPAGEIEQGHQLVDATAARPSRSGARRRGAASAASVSAGLLRLVVGGLEQVLVHGLARRVGVARADRLVDPPVRLGGVAQVALDGALRGLAPPLVVQRRHHLDQRRDDRIARRRRDAAVEVDVVDQEHAAARSSDANRPATSSASVAS